MSTLNGPVSGKIRQFFKTRRSKPGRPPLEWTPSRQRRLIRFVVDADVPWNYIEIAMEEPGFAPKKGNCRKQWQKMTNMNPNELRVKDGTKKELRKSQAIRAFESYQKRQRENQPPVMRHSPANSQIQIDSSRDAISSRSAAQLNDGTRSELMQNILTVPSLFSDKKTPAGSIPEMHTLQYDVKFVAPSDTYKETFARESSLTPQQAESQAQAIMPDGGKKRLAPLEFDLVTPGSTKRAPDFRFNSMGLEGLPAPSNETPIPDTMMGILPNPKDDAPDSDELQITVEKTSSDVTNLEDTMLVPRGFIDFFKHGLTITRPSVASVLSSSGSVRSRWSGKMSRQALPTLPEPSQEPGQLLFSNYTASQSPLERRSPQITSPMMTGGRVPTNLFWELLLPGETDAEIRNRLQTHLDAGADANARNLHGETPLHIALKLGNRPACQVLLEHGADVYAKTNDGKSLSEYGKIAQNKTGDDTKLYLAIKGCRNLIKEHNPRTKAQGGPEIGRATTMPSTVSRSLHELGGRSSGSSWVIPPNKSMTGEFEVCQQHPTQESRLIDYSKNFTETIQSSENPSRGFKDDRWNSGSYQTPPIISELRLNPAVRYDPNARRTHSKQPISRHDSVPARHVGRAGSVQSWENYFENRQSTRPSSISPPPQNSNLDAWNSQRPISTSPHVDTQIFNDAIIPAPTSRSPGFLNATKHPSESQSSPGQSTFPVDWQQQSSHSRQNEFGTQRKFSLNHSSPTKLSGYIDMLPTGQMALVCPISDDTNWKYVGQAPNSYSPALVRIISRSELAYSTIVQNSYISGNRGSSSAQVLQAWTPQTMTTIPSTPWVNSSPVTDTPRDPLQQSFLDNDAIVMEPANNGNDMLTTQFAGGGYALCDGLVEGWNYNLPGICS